MPYHCHWVFAAVLLAAVATGAAADAPAEPAEPSEMSLEDVRRWAAAVEAALEKAPKPPGRPPVRFPVFGGRLQFIAEPPDEIVPMERRAATALGVNGVTASNVPSRRADDAPFLKVTSRPILSAVGATSRLTFRDVAAKAAAAGFAPSKTWSVWDPASSSGENESPIEFTRWCENDLNKTAFRKWLKSRQVSLEELSLTNWDDVRLVPDENAETLALHYYSLMFGVVRSQEVLRKAWRRTGGGVDAPRTGTLFRGTLGVDGGGGLGALPDGWYDPIVAPVLGRFPSFTSPQERTLHADALRCAADRFGADVPCATASAWEVEASAAAFLGRGADALGWSGAERHYPAMRRVAYAIGAVESALVDAVPTT
ncbi:MAG: hypothetical protein ACRC1K_26825, partial [Planctomycetia bacterium]